ncbi:KpsF/GutQ family sugar-phosphate isomerase [Sporolactobacillus sp. THM7-7]|nr:KpsF/GutQ family sugar-phosphate isomerase [Sporolactobacillus sp. THM7-7]
MVQKTEKNRINYSFETRLKPKTNYMETFTRTIDTEVEELLKLKERIDPKTINDMVDMILNAKGRVVLTGMGKSGIIGRKISSTLASTGTPSFFLHPAEGLHGDLGRVTEKDIVFAISNSGETQEVLRILPSIRRIGARLISITGNSRSTLARRSNLTIDTGKIKEACPLGLAPTSTTTATLVLGDAIALTLLEVRDFKPEDFALFHPGGSLGRKLLLTVKGVLRYVNRVNPVADQNARVKEVLFKMTDSGIGALSIVNQDNELIGILTDGDIRKALQSGHVAWDQTISDIFTKNPYYVTSEQLATEALHLMEEKDINVLPVVKPGEKEPIAIIRIQDLTRIGL